MRLLLPTCLLVLLALSIAAPIPATAERIGPGTYKGWIAQDRWGEVALVQGVYRLALRGKAKTEALPWIGKSVTVEVTEIDAGDRVFDSTIVEVGLIEAAKPKHDGTLRLALQQPEIAPPIPHQQRFDVYVRYTGKDRMRLQSRAVKVLVRRRGGSLALGKLDVLKGVKDEWTRLEGHDAQKTPWVRAGASMDALEQGTRFQHQLVLRAPGGEFECDGAFTYHLDVMFELPPGEYEFVAVLGDDNFSSVPTPRSRITSFDVVGPKR